MENSNPKLFLEFSALLTGFSKIELKGTGMAEKYYETILQNTSRETIAYFFQDVEALFSKPLKPSQIDSIIASQFMPTSSYDGLARSIIILWYTGNWGDDVVSSVSYIQGLMWDAAHTHPPGAKQPGYGSWGELPLTVKR